MRIVLFLVSGKVLLENLPSAHEDFGWSSVLQGSGGGKPEATRVADIWCNVLSPMWPQRLCSNCACSVASNATYARPEPFVSLGYPETW